MQIFVHRLLIISMIILIKPISGAAEDHSEYLEGPFYSVHEVTEACLDCHDDAAESFMQSIHWTWGTDQNLPQNHRSAVVGKRTVLNNYCIGLESNEARCTSCHAGYGWKDASFDFEDPMNIDCLVCHENTGTYQKFPTKAGYPVDKETEFPQGSGKLFKVPDLEKIARSVGEPPTRAACGSCHYYGGGGNNVKHGDLDAVLINPSRELDVHMGGANMLCVDCHKTNDHTITGNAMSVSTQTSETLTCESCHGETPHEKNAHYLDAHAKTLACQSCHIPAFARANPTKMSWDWSQAGDSERKVNQDENGMPDYNKKKGAFVWGKNVIPTYAWYNGDSKRMLLGDQIDLNKINTIVAPIGSKADKSSKIYPFKVHTGKQIADKKNKYLLPTHLFNGGYWDHFDWEKSVTVGAEKSGIEYSGSYTFVETEMYWDINHMVAPKEEALKCKSCHSKTKDTRMDWKSLGYESDPRYTKGQSRTSMR